jgi:hypothetical protein
MKAFKAGRSIAAMLLSGVLLAGCGHLPNATVTYYLAQSEVSFKVLRTAACDAGGHLYIANAVTPSVRHSANLNDLVPLELATLRGRLSDTDVKFDFYDDGRLKGFNGSSTGQGEAILKTLVSIAAAAFGAEAAAVKQYPEACKAIKTVGGDKPVTLTYELTASLGHTQEQRFKPDALTAALLHAHAALQTAVGDVCATMVGEEAAPARAAYAKGGEEPVLRWREPAPVRFKVTVGDEKGCQLRPIWDDTLPIAQLGEEYFLPIPPPLAFGKRALTATFAESGALTSVQFVSATGAGQALNVLSSAQDATKGQTLAEKVAEVTAQADLIAQQQRLVRCVAEPAKCE